MIPDNTENDPTLFSKKSKSGTNTFSLGAGRGTAPAINPPEVEKKPHEINDKISIDSLSSQFEDNFENISENSRRIFRTNNGLALASPIFSNLFKVINANNINPDLLHKQFASMLRRYETQLATQGLAEKRVRLMLYGLAATIDDIILQKDWALESRWSQESMISLFFRETWGGERFFTLLKEMMSSAASYIKELELYYFCIQFGFEGRYRLASRNTELLQIRDDLFHVIRDSWGGLPFDLSPSWKGTMSLNPKTRPFKNLWYWCFLLIFIIVLLFLILSNLLQKKALTAAHNVNEMMNNPSIIAEQVEQPPTPQNPVTEPNKVDPFPTDGLKNNLSNWQNSGQINITIDQNKITIATTKELFASASTNLRDPYPVIIEQIAKELNKLPGKIEVIGHTDNIPIRSGKFADNLALSEARAKTVANLLANFVSDQNRISSKGVGADNPIAPNTTAQGRLANRRVDIILVNP